VRVVIIGCGRVGAGLASGLAGGGDVVAVIDKDPKAFERLGEDFTGQTVEGIGFDRDVLERAGAARADALVAVTSGDNSNVVAARVARDAYRVPRVIARIHDPRRAALYEELGIVTVSSTDWALRKIRDYLEHRTLKEESAFGRGEISLLRLELPQHLVDRPVADIEGQDQGLRVVSITRRGGAFVPGPATMLAEGDVVRLAVQDVVALHRTERGNGVALVELTLDEDAPAIGHRPADLQLPAGATTVAVVRGDQVLAGADAGPFEPADEVLALTTLQAEPELRRLLGGQPGGSHTPAG
jgi:trk system potassium uptake protein TrkA